MKSSHLNGFTLLEVLTVVALIAALSVVLGKGLGRTGESTALAGAQVTLANLITVARTHASSTGRKTRLLVAVDSRNADHYLRYCILQVARQAGSSPVNWDTLTEVMLPEGIYVVPPDLGAPRGLVSPEDRWKRESDPQADLSSDLFQGQSLAVSLPGEVTTESYTGFAFTPNGTLAALGIGPPPKGYLVLAPGRKLPPGSIPAVESPVQLQHPAAVRGLLLSAYGVPALLNDRFAF